MRKPFNSPMLIGSVASVSASSPASGDVVNGETNQAMGLNYGLTEHNAGR